jgi:hypothetical protein
VAPEDVHEVVIGEGFVDDVPIDEAAAEGGGGFGYVIGDDFGERGGIVAGVGGGFLSTSNGTSRV